MTGKNSGPGSPAADKASGPTYVQVPTDLPDVSDAALTLWILFVWRAGRDKTCNPGLPRLQVDFGRAGSDPRHIGGLVGELELADMLRVKRRTTAGKTRNEYEPLRRVVPKGAPGHDPNRRWVDLPGTVIADLRDKAIKPERIAALVRWLILARAKGGWTSLGFAEVAKMWGQCARTVKRHRTDLIAAGLLEERVRHNADPITAPPGKLPPKIVVAAPEVVEPPPEVSEPVTNIPADHGQISPLIMDRIPRQNYPDVVLSRIELSTSVPVGTDVTAVTARGRAPAASPKIENLSHPVNPARTRPAPGSPSPTAWETLGALPRPWRDCHQWVRRRLAARIDRALTQCAPAAIVNAVTTYAPDPTMAADQHTVALDFVLTELAGDVKAGHCPMCGHHHQDAASAACGCCAVKSDVWLIADASSCIACDNPNATVRDGLPMGSAVCDACWSVELVAA